MNTPGYYGAASDLYGPDPRSNYYNPLLAFSPPPGGYNMGGGGGGVVDQYQQAYDRARQENLQRYQDILGGYAARYGRAMLGMEKEGDYERQDIKARHKQVSAQTLAALGNRGLVGSTIAPVMQRGNVRDMNRDVGALEERLRQQRRGWDANLSGDMLSFMERRTDAYPDMNQLIHLATLAGNAGPGGMGGVQTQDGMFNNAPAYGGMNPFMMAMMMQGNRPLTHGYRRQPGIFG